MVIITHSYDKEGFRLFIEKIKDKSCREIIKRSKKELKKIRISNKDDTNYAEFLRCFLFFLQWKKKPKSISKQEFQLFYPVFKNLSSKENGIGPDYLRFFEEKGKNGS